MAKRIKTIPAIEPNAGLKAALQKRLIALIEKQTREATAELLRNLIDSGCFTQPVETVAQDAALWGRKEKKIIDEAIRAFKASNPADAARKLDLSLAEKMARWMIHAGENAKLVSGWFVRAMAQNVTASQRRALIRAGITPTLLKEKWTIPIVKNRYMAPSTAKALPGLVDGMTGLITKMQADDLARVRETITRGLYEGQSLGEIESVLKASRGFTEARAKRVALDQSIKVSQGIQRGNAEALGITHAVWVHVPGRYSSRETHIAMDGKRFDLSEGLYDPAVGQNVTPGLLPFCRCIFRLDISDILK